MNKKVVSLTLLLSLLATAGCDASAKAKTIKDDNGDKVDVMYTYTDPTTEEETYVTADDVYADLLDSTAGSKALFEAVYKKVIKESISEEKNKEIEKEVDEEMVTWLQDAKDQAADNGVSQNDMVDALLEEEGVDSEEELTEKKIYEKQKTYVEDDYFDENRNEGLDLVNKYVKSYYPVHVKGILVKVADSNYTYFARSISEAETKKLARTTEALISGKNFNILASDSNFSDHSTSQITTGGDLGIMDVTTGFNNEYKLGIYTYFAYGANDAKTNTQAKFLLTGNDATLVSRYDELYKDGFNVITSEQVTTLANSAEVKRNALGDLVVSNSVDGDYQALNMPRNVIYNNYFNSHKVSFLAATADTEYKVTVNCAATDSGKGNAEVVANQYGYPILVLTDENGVQFISVEMDAFGANQAAADEYFGATEGDKVTVTLNGTEKSLTPYFAQAGNSNKNSRKESVDTQIRNFINKGFGNAVSSNQDFYYYRIYNEFIENSENGTKEEIMTSLFGSADSKYCEQVTSYINNIIAYREALIEESRIDTGEKFANTLDLQANYEKACWVRPMWLAAADEATFKDGNDGSTYDLKYWNTHLGGGALYA